jgi:hypothetical protein
MSLVHNEPELLVVCVRFGPMFELLHRTLVIGAIAFGFTLTAVWAAFLGYGLFWLTALVLEWSVE